MKELNDIIYIPDYMVVLTIFNENKELSVSDLHHKTLISYTTLHQMKKIFVENGWVTIKKIGLRHIVLITPKGEEIVNYIYELTNVLGIDKNKLSNIALDRKHKNKKVNTNEEDTEEIIDEKHTTDVEGNQSATGQDTERDGTGTADNSGTERSNGESI